MNLFKISQSIPLAKERNHFLVRLSKEMNDQMKIDEYQEETKKLDYKTR